MCLTRPFAAVYWNLLHELLYSGATEANARTGRRVKSHRGGTAFTLDLSDGLLPVPGLRKVFPRTAAAEVAWFLSGQRDVTWLRKYAPIWDKFVEDDGVTVDSAYGYRWRVHFGRDQIGEAIHALLDDQSSRRVYVSAWDPSYDGLTAKGQRNVPCPTSFTLSIVEGRLYSSLFLRSSDVFVGLPYDVMGHALLMAAVAASLAVGLGTMHFTLAHPHLYEAHWGMATEALAQYAVVRGPDLPVWPVAAIEARPDDYVARVKELASRVEWPTYSPRPEVIQ